MKIENRISGLQTSVGRLLVASPDSRHPARKREVEATGHRASSNGNVGRKCTNAADSARDTLGPSVLDACRGSTRRCRSRADFARITRSEGKEERPGDGGSSSGMSEHARRGRRLEARQGTTSDTSDESNRSAKHASCVRIPRIKPSEAQAERSKRVRSIRRTSGGTVVRCQRSGQRGARRQGKLPSRSRTRRRRAARDRLQ